MDLARLAMGLALSTAVGLSALAIQAEPVAAHPCFDDNPDAFLCFETNADGPYVCAGTWNDDNGTGGLDHPAAADERNTFACSNGELPG